MLDHDARSYALIARVFDSQPEGLRDDILENVTLLADEHGGFFGSSLLAKQASLFCPKRVAIPSP
jgi:hypothetical protein